MKYLGKMIDHMRTYGCIVMGPMSRTPQRLDTEYPTRTEWNYIEKVEPFVFRDAEPIEDAQFNDRYWEGGLDTTTKLDAPFPVFSIECLNSPIEKFPLGELWGEEAYGNTMCVLTVEFAPHEFGYYEYVEYYDKNGLQRTGVWKANTSGKVVSAFLERLKREKVGMETTRQKIKIGNGSEKRIHRIRRIIHVCPKKYSDNYNTENSVSVNWSHRWEVRGHWVKLDPENGLPRLGKDRDGNYCIAGWTWRVHHTKGPEHLPLIKKTRIVEPGEKS